MQIPSLQQLLEAGVHFGHQTRRGNPRMRPYIYGAREGVHIIDLTLSEKLLKEACDYVRELGKSGGILLFVGTKKQAQPIIEELAKKTDSPYLKNRWIGGFLTNFDEIQKNIKKLKELKEQKEAGALSKYTKKEQLLIERRVGQLERDLGGVGSLDRTPDAIFIVDCVKEATAVREANIKGVKLVAITDSNSDPSLVDFPIPGNDDAIKSIRILSEAVAEALLEGRKEAGKEAVKVADKKAKEEAKAEAEAANAQSMIDSAVVADVAIAEEVIEKKELEEAKREG
jgi:small subunit ribosomal protein S2